MKKFLSMILVLVLLISNIPILPVHATEVEEIDIADIPAEEILEIEVEIQEEEPIPEEPAPCDHAGAVPTVTPPTCTEQGYTTYVCECGETYTDNFVDSLGHNHVEEVVAPTCTEQGYTSYTCHCGDNYKDAYVEALGHTGGTATCDEPAICERCGDPRGEVNSDNHGETEIRNAKDANCTEEGYTGDICCIECGAVLEEGQILPIAHDYVITVIDPTYTKPGYTQYTCECGDHYTSDEAPATGLPAPVLEITEDPKTGGGTLTWNGDDEADAYKVYRATSRNGKYKLLATVEDETSLKVSAGAGKKYYYKVRAICEEDSDLNSSYSNIVSITGKCAQPDVTATSNTASGKPTVFWKKISGAKKYYIYRVDENGERTQIKSTTGTSYTDSKAVLGNTYTYQVRAIGSKSSYNSEYSESVSCLTVLAQPVIKVSVSSDTGKATITWKSISGAISYNIYRSADGSNYIMLDSVSGTSFEDTSAAADAVYWYKVEAAAENPDWNSADSAAKKAQIPLARPTTKANVDPISGKPTISWSSVEATVQYKVYRSTSSAKNYKCCATITDPAVTEWVDNSVSAGKTYYYKVMAIGQNTKSSYSNYVKITGKCAQPEITVTPNAASGKPTVSWKKSSGAKKYYVYRVDENGERTQIKSTTGTSYTDTKAVLGETYSYQVKAIASKSIYNSEYSEVVSCLTVLAQPVIQVKVNSQTGKAAISWKPISGASGYEVYRAAEGGEYEIVGTVTETNYEDTSAVADTVCWYKVKAIAEDPALNSPFSSAKKAQISLARPSIGISNDPKTGKPVISWGSVEGAIQYKIYRSSSATKNYKCKATISDLTVTEWQDSSVSAGKGYYYKVIAIGVNAKSSYSSYIKVYGKCAQPQVSVEISDTTGKPVLSWNKVSGAKKYSIYRTLEDGAEEFIGSTTKTSYTDKEAGAAKTYTYRVLAIGSKSSYNSEYSDPVVCRTVCAAPEVEGKIDAATGKPVLSWNAVFGAVNYEIYRSDNGNEYALLATRAETSYADAAANLNTTYWYKVKTIAEDPSMSSPDSTPVKIHTTMPAPVLTGSNEEATGDPIISWNAVEGVKSYKLYRSTYATKNYAAVTETTDLSYTDTSVTAGKAYYYKIIAIGDGIDSEYSDYIQVYAKLEKPTAGIGLNIDGHPTPKWNEVKGAKEYHIYRAEAADADPEYIGKSTGKSYIDKTTKAGKIYYYYIKAVPAKAEAASTFCDVMEIKSQALEEIDLEELITYGINYGVETYGYRENRDCYAGYYPGYHTLIRNMDEGKAAVKECVDGTTKSLLARPDMEDVVGAYLNISIDPYEAIDNCYVVFVYYG